MGFQRREGLAGGGITKYADKNVHNCPFCGTTDPHWLTDAYIAQYSLIASKCVNGYKFKCEKCGGIFEIQANTDFCFQNETFSCVKLIDSGLGKMNVDKINIPITIGQLKKLSLDAPNNGVYTEETPEHKQLYQQYDVAEISNDNFLYATVNNNSGSNNVFSILSLIFGIVISALTTIFVFSAFDDWVYGINAFVFGIQGAVPLVFGIISLAKNTVNKGKALTGLILGAVSLFLGFIGIVIYIV